MGIEMMHNIRMNDVLKHFTTNTGQGHWAVIFCQSPKSKVTLFINRGDILF